jgi:hypothetical protein
MVPVNVTGRTQYTRMGTDRSPISFLTGSVLQESVLGPVLFLLYLADLVVEDENIIIRHSLCPHLYAYDTHIYGSCHPNDIDQLKECFSTCIDEVASWMRANRLQVMAERIDFKLAVTVYRCLHDLAPIYLSRDICRTSSLASRLRLQLSSSSSLEIPRCRLSTVGDRAFTVAAAKVWNSLPEDVSAAPSLTLFRKRLKTVLFRRSFNVVI